MSRDYRKRCRRCERYRPAEEVQRCEGVGNLCVICEAQHYVYCVVCEEWQRKDFGFDCPYKMLWTTFCTLCGVRSYVALSFYPQLPTANEPAERHIRSRSERSQKCH